MRYLMREAVGAVLNEGSDLEDFSASGSEENIVDSGKEFVPVDLEVDSSDSDNDIFIFVIGCLVVYLLRFFLNGLKQCIYRSRECHFVVSRMS